MMDKAAFRTQKPSPKMPVFFTDLDNTMIYSYRREIGADKYCVELYQGREVSFVTAKARELMRRVSESALIVPVTTRTREQYERIDLGLGTPEYALVCNGGVLLTRGLEDRDWQEQALSSIFHCQDELNKARILMEQDENRSFEVRNIRNLFLFTKSREPERSAEFLRDSLNHDLLEVFQNGGKVYAVPRNLNKGAAVKRLCQRICKQTGRDVFAMAAGDSAFDVSMLRAAELSFAPVSLVHALGLPDNMAVREQGAAFSEAVLRKALKKAQELEAENA